jgi:hypothetical protein
MLVRRAELVPPRPGALIHQATAITGVPFLLGYGCHDHGEHLLDEEHPFAARTGHRGGRL